MPKIYSYNVGINNLELEFENWIVIRSHNICNKLVNKYKIEYRKVIVVVVVVIYTFYVKSRNNYTLRSMSKNFCFFFQN